MNFKTALKVFPQYLLPQHHLSKLMRCFTHSEQPALKNLLIRQVIRHYGVNMDDAAENDLNAYPSFNHFFTRALKPGVRPINDERWTVVSPADGVVSQAGAIQEGRIFQAKGKSFSASALLGGENAELFKDGLFATIYLSPKDYHRLHMPMTGTLTEMTHIPGRLFSVNQTTAENVPDLFARNERVVCLFDTVVGPMALVLVGAIFVSSIETVWHGIVTPPTQPKIRRWRYSNSTAYGELPAPTLQKGEEMGRFNMGSTIIVLFGKDAVQWYADFNAGTPVNFGQAIGNLQ